MNKKELAKLLFQTTEIKELFESQQFDTATINKVIAQEIMREQEEEPQESEPTLPELEANLKFAMAQLKGYKETFAEKRNEYRVARTARDTDAADDARSDMETIRTLIKDEDEKILDLSNKIELLKKSARAAAQTEPQDDDQVVAAVAKRVGDEIKAAAELLSNNPEDNRNVAGQIAQSVVEPIKQAVDTVKKVTAAEPPAEPESSATKAPYNRNYQGISNLFSAENYTWKPDGENFASLIGKAVGSTDTKNLGPMVAFPLSQALRKSFSLASSTFGIENLELEDIIPYVNKSFPISSKIEQAAKELSEMGGTKDLDSRHNNGGGSLQGFINSEETGKAIRGVISQALEQSKQAAASSGVSLKPFAEQDTEGETTVGDGTLPAADTPPSAPPEAPPEPEASPEPEATDAPEPETAPEAEAAKGWANSKAAARARVKDDTSLEQIQASLQSPEAFKEFWGSRGDVSEKMKQARELFDNGYFDQQVEKLKQKAATATTPEAEEEIKDDAAELFATAVSFDQYLEELPEDYESPFMNNAPEILGFLPSMDIPTSPEEFKSNFLDTIEAAIEETAPEAEETADVTAETEEVIENTPEADAEADGERPPPPQAEFDQKNLDLLKTFFGDNPQKSGFMKQFLLKNQAKMLVDMIGALNQIIAGQPSAGEDGEEERALTDDEPDATTRPAENPEGDADEVGEDDTEYIEEQVINEIFSRLFKNEDEEVEISSSGTKFMRQDLEAMVDLLRSLKKDIGKYESYATRKSVNPSFNGSSLKEAMDAKLKVVQDAIAHLIKVIDNEIKNQREEVENEEPVDESLNSILGENKSERKMKIEKVKEVYNEMRRMYEKGLKVSLENNEFEESKRGAEEIKDYVLSQKDFMGYFPRNVITSGGQVMTLGAAHKAMIEITGKFIETIRDVVTITRTQRVSFPNLVQATEDLIDISIAIESMFNIPSQIKGEIVDEFEEFQAEDEDNVSLSDEPTSPSEEGGEPEEEDEVRSGQVASSDVMSAVNNHFKGDFSSQQRQDFARLWQVVANELSEELAFAVDEYLRDEAPEEDPDDLEENKGKNVEKYLRMISFNGKKIKASDQEELRKRLGFIIDESVKTIMKEIDSYAYPKVQQKIYDISSRPAADTALEEIESSLRKKLQTGLDLKFKPEESYNDTIGKLLRAISKDGDGKLDLRPFAKDFGFVIAQQAIADLMKDADTKDLFADDAPADEPDSPESEEGETLDTPEDGDTGEAPETKDDAETDTEADEGEVDEGPSEYDRKLKIANETRENYRGGAENTISKRFSNTKKVRGKPSGLPGIEGLAGNTAVMLQSFYAAAVIGADNKGMGDSNRNNDVYDVMPSAQTSFTKEAIENTIKWIDSTSPEDDKDAAQREVLKKQNDADPEGLVKKLRSLFRANNRYVQDEIDRRWEERTGNRTMEEALKPIINKMLKEHYNR